MRRYQDMTAAEHAAVAKTLAEYLQPLGDSPGCAEILDPITPGTVRYSRSGAPWVTFYPPEHQGQLGKRYFQLRDAPPAPGDTDYSGFECVLDQNGNPLGNSEGVLVLHSIKNCLYAHVVQTGWNYESEIIWEE